MATYETYETEEDYDTMAEPNVNEATPTVRLFSIVNISDEYITFPG